MPIFLVVFWIVRALWVAYVATLTESQLHQRVFDHGTAVSVTLLALCLVLALFLSLGVGRFLAVRRPHA